MSLEYDYFGVNLDIVWEFIVITAYAPDTALCEPGFRRSRP